MNKCTALARLHIEAHGNGLPLVLAHGFGGSSRNFLPQAHALERTHRVWLYDARGHARSDAPSDLEAFGWPCLVSDFDRVVHQSLTERASKNDDRAIVGGLSLGAATALFWAIQNQEAVKGLVLAAYPNCSAEMGDWATNFARQIELEGIDRAGNQFVWGPLGRFKAEEARQIRRGFLEHSELALSAILRQAVAQIPDISRFSDDLERFHVPTFILAGANDTLTLATSRWIAGTLPNAQLAIIENAGHVVNLSQPKEFNLKLAEFVRGL
jgi:pimeloyl-ACP methyl ester carboxylesterase